MTTEDHYNNEKWMKIKNDNQNNIEYKDNDNNHIENDKQKNFFYQWLKPIGWTSCNDCNDGENIGSMKNNDWAIWTDDNDENAIEFWRESELNSF